MSPTSATKSVLGRFSQSIRSGSQHGRQSSLRRGQFTSQVSSESGVYGRQTSAYHRQYSGGGASVRNTSLVIDCYRD